MKPAWIMAISLCCLPAAAQISWRGTTPRYVSNTFDPRDPRLANVPFVRPLGLAVVPERDPEVKTLEMTEDEQEMAALEEDVDRSGSPRNRGFGLESDRRNTKEYSDYKDVIEDLKKSPQYRLADLKNRKQMRERTTADTVDARVYDQMMGSALEDQNETMRELIDTYKGYLEKRATQVDTTPAGIRTVSNVSEK
jgi:hypothetical protein